MRTNTYACSVGSAWPSLLHLFRLKVASLVKRQLFGVFVWAYLLCVSGAEKANTLFPCCHQIDYCCLNSVDRPLQQRELFNPTSLTVVWGFFPKQNVNVVLDLSSRSVNMDLAAWRMLFPICNASSTLGLYQCFRACPKFFACASVALVDRKSFNWRQMTSKYRFCQWAKGA